VSDLRIFYYPVHLGYCRVYMPNSAKALYLDVDPEGEFAVWALIDAREAYEAFLSAREDTPAKTDAESRDFFLAVATDRIPLWASTYVGTAKHNGFVAHLFESDLRVSVKR
jgi:hypothetical protein